MDPRRPGAGVGILRERVVRCAPSPTQVRRGRHAVHVEDLVRRAGDAEARERRAHRAAVVEPVVGVEPLVRRQHRVEHVAELELDRRQVVQRAQHHPQQVGGGDLALLGDAGRVQPVALVEGLQPRRPHAGQGLHERRHQDLGPAVRLVVLGVREPRRGRRDRHRAAQRLRALVPTRPALPGPAQLFGQPEERAPGRGSRAVARGGPRGLGPGQGAAPRRHPHPAAGVRLEVGHDHAGQGEDRQQGDQVGQRLVEGQLVRQAGLDVARAAGRRGSRASPRGR